MSALTSEVHYMATFSTLIYIIIYFFYSWLWTHEEYSDWVPRFSAFRTLTWLSHGESYVE